MKINYTENITRSVELQPAQVTEITIKRLKQLVYPGQFLRTEKGQVYLKKDEDNWRHGSVSEEVVRVATDFDKAVFLVLESLST